MYNSSLVWIRRDLRLSDHHALAEATKNYKSVYLVFVFDPTILKKLDNSADQRVGFIVDSLYEMEEILQKQNGGIHFMYGDPCEMIPQLARELKVDAVFTNRDYEPYAKKRDEKVERKLKQDKIEFLAFRDQVVYEGFEILNGQGEPYKVFTPFKNRWLEINREHMHARLEGHRVQLKKISSPLKKYQLPSKEKLFDKIEMSYTRPFIEGGEKAASKMLKRFATKIQSYKEVRDFPALEGTSNLSVHLRHGTISIRECFNLAFSGKSVGHQTWASELIWREFYQMILDQFPHVAQGSFRPEYDKIKWSGSKRDFEAWKKGITGFPIIDAAMRCFTHTGMMHNRLRMIVASFLCKTLLCDWRWGEEYFAQHLLDFDLAANNGGWQWCSSSGCDAQPYFRIFNPYNQSEKFDPKGVFIREWVPEISHLSDKEIHRPPEEINLFDETNSYPLPIVSYEKNRQKALDLYSAIKIKK